MKINVHAYMYNIVLVTEFPIKFLLQLMVCFNYTLDSSGSGGAG